MKEAYKRKRNKYVNFRVTPEEYELLNRYVAASGMIKQDYIIHNLLRNELVIYGNSKTFIGLKRVMIQILRELKRIEASNEISKEYMDFMKYVTVLFDKLINNSCTEERR